MAQPGRNNFIFKCNDSFFNEVLHNPHTNGQGDPWFFERAWAEIKLVDAKIDADDSLTLKIENIGGLPVFFDVEVVQLDGQVVSKRFSTSVWSKSDQTIEIKIEGIKFVNNYKVLNLLG